ncbi:class I SAM-dependent methyltransferase [Cnuibacter physcomitrellae]|uniref:class I SAM-dependent methyltransferase n=1 Tax=Cnuibacter physcomitrellae TaxID=1619308 RepID=UPI002175E729|nr:class I SAM-dependent methyltransferase [Cnuibacter physcomitrellae]MCS5497223.1 class I SAM-dependent methyltransferase [Cnuibacter physcomitrellae]
MTGNDRFLEANRANWDDRATLHAARTGSGYETGRFVDDRELLSDVVTFDRERLGDIRGLDVVHLQCHIGTDTLSLARLGAQSVVGLDFSESAIAEARRLVAETGDAVEYVRSDVDGAIDALGAGRFDLVYTGIGALCWLPRIRDWASVVARLLRPGGRLFIREAHPILWTMDERIQPTYPYFEHAEPLEWDEDDSYVETTRKLTATKTFEWNHGLGEIVTALLDEGLAITGLVEHETVPYVPFPGLMVEAPLREWALAERAGTLPLTYTLQARKVGEAQER